MADIINFPAPASSDDEAVAEIARLATLAPVIYGRERKAAAKRLSVPVTILDKAVASERKKVAALENELVKDTEPWTEQVDGSDLLYGLATKLLEFVVMDADDAIV